MSEFDALSAAAAGMEAQRAALDVAARNVAAAEAADDGGAFERLVPRFVTSRAVEDDDLERDGENLERAFDFAEPSSADFGVGDAPIRFVGTSRERGVGVDAITEMVAVLNAQRAYEANASVFDLGKRLAERTIELGRGS